MTYNELLQLIPDSVYTRKEGSNNQKLWGLYASQFNEIETVLEDLRLVRDVEEQSGEVLDLIGEILREQRDGNDDPAYALYLAVALQKLLCGGSIPSLQDVLRAIAGDDFVGVWDLTPATEDELYSDDRVYTDGTMYLDGSSFMSGETPDGETSPHETYLDNSFYLDGSFFLSGTVFQPGYIEVVLYDTVDADILSYITRIMDFIKSAGIKYRIRLVEA